MIVVLIHWKIHLHERARAAFFAYWRDVLQIENRDAFIGEYLSEPLTAEQTGFACSLMNTPPSPKYTSYFNVGLWKDTAAFKAEIVDPYVGTTPKTLPFEYEFRERMILLPASRRTGLVGLPSGDEYQA